MSTLAETPRAPSPAIERRTPETRSPVAAPLPARLRTVDALRGLAAGAVAWFHLTNMDWRFLPAGALKSSGHYGWLGVEIFFVLSGFIIPWSLQRVGYTTSAFARFVVRRVVRLDPPYLASVLLVLALAVWLPTGPITPLRVALHLGYANVFFGERWLNPVYWTLAIELQWYLLVGMIHPLVASADRRRRTLTLVALCAAALLPAPTLPISALRSFIFPYLGFFVMGLAAFQWRAGIGSRRELWLALLAGAAVSAYRVGALPAVIGLATALTLVAVELRLAALLWLGEISYSLYLVHSPVALLFVHYAVEHHLGLAGRIGMLVLASLATLAAAWLLWRFVERPSQRWASRIRYR